jgi:hypothetical protein
MTSIIPGKKDGLRFRGSRGGVKRQEVHNFIAHDIHKMIDNG